MPGGDAADSEQSAPQVLERLVEQAERAGASDIHLHMREGSAAVAFRLDGVMTPTADLPAAIAERVFGRIKFLARLKTYQESLPQDGRIDKAALKARTDIRVATYPTVTGEKIVLRLFDTTGIRPLAELGFPPEVRTELERFLRQTAGLLLLTGPAGSGKTTTIYACLREIARQSGGARSLMTIEDPVEVSVRGVAQSQVHPTVGLDLAAGLRFLMRQDPEVIMVGEIRDRPTAEAALQASLTGHLLLSTFHAGSAAETVGRLLDMGIEPYVLRSGILAILHQRLLRRLCTCAEPSDKPEAKLGLDVQEVKLPRGCPECGGTGYRGRFLLVEMLMLSRTDLARAVLTRSDTATIERLAVEGGMVTRWQRACRAVDDGRTSPAEVRRVLGFSGSVE